LISEGFSYSLSIAAQGMNISSASPERYFL